MTAVDMIQRTDEPVFGPLAGDCGPDYAGVVARPENRGSGRSGASGDAPRLESWLAHACQRDGTHSVLRRNAQRFGPIREPATFAAALTALADLDRVQLVSEGKRRLIRLTQGAPVDVVGSADAPTEAVAVRASVATAESEATVATGPCVASVAASVLTGSVASVATVADLSEADRDWLEERAAILEFDGGLKRDDAEAEARRLIVAAGRRAK
jgi:hypothetical protein